MGTTTKNHERVTAMTSSPGPFGLLRSVDGARAYLRDRLQREIETAQSDSARVAAIQIAARMHGLLTDKVQVECEMRSSHEVMAEIEARLARLTLQLRVPSSVSRPPRRPFAVGGQLARV